MEKTEQIFRQLLIDAGYSEKAIQELWKWYDPLEKKRERTQKQHKVSWPWIWD